MIRSLPAALFGLYVVALVLFTGCGNQCDNYQSQMRTCMNSYCRAEGADTAACSCWVMGNGNDVNTGTCTCTSYGWDEFCTSLQNQGIHADQIVDICREKLNVIIAACHW